MGLKVVYSSELANRFLSENTDLSRDIDGIRIQVIEKDGRLSIMLELGVYLSNPTTAIRNTASLASQWLDRLLEFQGPWMGGGENDFLERISLMQEDGYSYKVLAQMINKRIENYLREYLIYQEVVDRIYPGQGNTNNIYYPIYSGELEINGFGPNHSRYLLRIFALKDDEIDLFLRDGLERLVKGENPFDQEYPISQLKVIDKLRTWRNGKKHKALEKIRKHEE